MCMQVECGKCHKKTWAGCGSHKESALVGVPEEQRCKCPREEQELGVFGRLLTMLHGQK